MTTRAWVSDQKALIDRHSSRTLGLERLDMSVAPGLTGRDEVQTTRHGPVALSRTMLPNHPAREALTDPHLCPHSHHRGPTTLRA